MGTYNSLSEFKEKNAEEGFHFFEDDTMSFFDSRIETGLFEDDTFITSEKTGPRPSAGRGYTIRRALPDGSVQTVSEFNEFDTLDDARQARKKKTA